jgi:flagellar motor switch protein FliM
MAETADTEEEMSDDERMAAEWAAMAEEDEDGNSADDNLAAEWAAMDDGDALEEDIFGPTTVQPTRILNQDEIDSLLGFRDDDEDGANRSGILAIVNSALVSYERLPYALIGLSTPSSAIFCRISIHT